MTSSTSRNRKPDTRRNQQSESTRAVMAMLGFDHATQQSTLARMVAAAICEDSNSALERFASSGVLDSQALLDELDQVEVPFEQEAWVDALARFALFGSEAHHG